MQDCGCLVSTGNVLREPAALPTKCRAEPPSARTLASPRPLAGISCLPQIPRRGGPSKIGEGDQHVAHGPVILVVGVQAHGTVAGKKQRGVVLGAIDHGVEQAG